MTQEEKQLLLIELSARLPYRVQYKDAHGYKKTLDIWSPEFHTALNTILYDGKPSLYLRPMSSMTEEEGREVRILWNEDFVDKISIYHCYPKTTNFYNKHHLDYRGLIEKGLALEAPKDMYNTKTKKYD